jgi:hypothetical protein
MDIKLDMYPVYSRFEKLVGRDTSLSLIGLKSTDDLKTKHVPDLLEVMRCHLAFEHKGKLIVMLKPVCWCNLEKTPYMNALEYYSCARKGPFASGEGWTQLQLSLARVIEQDLMLEEGSEQAMEMAELFMKKYRTPYPALEVVFGGIGMLECCGGIQKAYRMLLTGQKGIDLKKRM